MSNKKETERKETKQQAESNRFAGGVVNGTDAWAEKIKNEFKINIQAAIPANRHALLLPDEDIYYHLKALSYLEDKAHSQYTADDPALFQKALSEDVTDYLLLHDYLDKAARVGNQALVQWLMAPERGAQRVSPDDDTLRSAVISENLALVQWLVASERGEQRVEFTSELILEVRRGLGGEVMKHWVEQTLQRREASTTAPLSAQRLDNQTQPPLSSESKTLHAGDGRV